MVLVFLNPDVHKKLLNWKKKFKKQFPKSIWNNSTVIDYFFENPPELIKDGN